MNTLSVATRALPSEHKTYRLISAKSTKTALSVEVPLSEQDPHKYAARALAESLGLDIRQIEFSFELPMGRMYHVYYND